MKGKVRVLVLFIGMARGVFVGVVVVVMSFSAEAAYY